MAFWPGIAGAATSPRWAIAAVSLFWLDWYGILFSSLCFGMLGFDQAVHWAIVSAAFCWGLNANNKAIRSVVFCFCCGIAISGCIAALQRYGEFDAIQQLVIPGGLFLNKNVLSEASALAFIAAVCARLWPAALICLPALILSTTRAAWIGACVGLFLFLSWRWRIALLLIFCVAAFLVFVNGYSPNLGSLYERFSIWNDALRNMHWFGNGSYDYSTVKNREPNLHNDWLQLVYELGVFGFIPIILVFMAGSHTTAVPFIACLFVIGSFGFPLHNPASAWFAAFFVGHYVGRVLDERRTAICERSFEPRLPIARPS